MQQYLAYFKENFLMINGKPGSGKTYLGLHIAAMRVINLKKTKVMYLVPSRQALISLLRILYSGAIHEGETLKQAMLVLEPSDE